MIAYTIPGGDGQILEKQIGHFGTYLMSLQHVKTEKQIYPFALVARS